MCFGEFLERFEWFMIMVHIFKITFMVMVQKHFMWIMIMVLKLYVYGHKNDVYIKKNTVH